MNAACPAPFAELFAGGYCTAIDAATKADLAKSGAADVFTAMPWFERAWRDYFGAECTWPAFVAALHRAMTDLRPRAEIEATAAAFAARHRLADVVGLHIRHTDNLRAYAGWAEKRGELFEARLVSQVEGFTDVIAGEAAAGRPCYVATDDVHIADRLSRTYGSTVVLLPKSYATAGVATLRTTSVADALVELRLLGRCRRVVGTYYSSFSKLSAILGGTDYCEMHGREPARNVAVDRLQAELRAAAAAVKRLPTTFI